jgi:hypothetical protein
MRGPGSRCCELDTRLPTSLLKKLLRNLEKCKPDPCGRSREDSGSKTAVLLVMTTTIFKWDLNVYTLISVYYLSMPCCPCKCMHPCFCDPRTSKELSVVLYM